MAASMGSSSGSDHINYLPVFASSCGIPTCKLREPLRIRNAINSWPCNKWTVLKLVDIFDKKKLKFRIGPHNVPAGSVLWEGLCSYQEARLADFHEWCTAAPGDVPPQNPLHGYRRDEYWCYADYKYMKDLFSDHKEVLEAVRWATFGLEGYSGEQSTLWVGSAGAHTVCHQDSYGFNLVAQIQGRKKWYLFPPEQTDCLYPTRVPYEESSVFSAVNITDPDLERHPKFCDATPYVVTLEPGDVLYVPQKWWHFVECLDTSISVNCWVEQPEDHLSRVQESIVRLLMFRFLGQPEQSSQACEWLNPTETVTSHETNLSYLEMSLEVVKRLRGTEHRKTKRRHSQEECPPPPAKRAAAASQKTRDEVFHMERDESDSCREHLDVVSTDTEGYSMDVDRGVLAGDGRRETKERHSREKGPPPAKQIPAESQKTWDNVSHEERDESGSCREHPDAASTNTEWYPIDVDRGVSAVEEHSIREANLKRCPELGGQDGLTDVAGSQSCEDHGDYHRDKSYDSAGEQVCPKGPYHKHQSELQRSTAAVPTLINSSAGSLPSSVDLSDVRSSSCAEGRTHRPQYGWQKGAKAVSTNVGVDGSSGVHKGDRENTQSERRLSDKNCPSVSGIGSSKFEIEALYPVRMGSLLDRKLVPERLDATVNEELTMEETLVRCLTDPRVISSVTKLLLEKVKGS